MPESYFRGKPKEVRGPRKYIDYIEPQDSYSDFFYAARQWLREQLVESIVAEYSLISKGRTPGRLFIDDTGEVFRFTLGMWVNERTIKFRLDLYKDGDKVTEAWDESRVREDFGSIQASLESLAFKLIEHRVLRMA